MGKSSIERYLAQKEKPQGICTDIRTKATCPVIEDTQKDINQTLSGVSGQEAEAYLRTNDVDSFNRFYARFKEQHPDEILCYDGTILIRAKLPNINLSGVFLCRAHFRSAKLMNANFSDANLLNADLTSADLTGADLTGANLKGCRLRYAVLTDAVGLTSEQLSVADWRYAIDISPHLLPLS